MPLSLAAALVLQAAAPGAAAPPGPDAASPNPAGPDTAGRSGPAAQSDGGGDVVVTARRRSESVQRVPIAISVIGGTAIAETGANNVGRLTQLQPSLQFYSSNPRNSAANIRGLGAPFGLTNDGIEQGVGIYVDQVYNARIAAATFDFTDIDRIEILRGPQGTLYGKNTTAGAINIVSRPPSFSPEARVELTGGNYDFFQGKASVSGPLIGDTLALRVSTSITTRRGTIYDTALRSYENSQDNQSVRAQLLWRPASNLDVTLYGDYNHQDPNCCVQYYVRTGATQRPLNRQYAALAAAQGYRVPSTDPFDRVTDLDARPLARQKIGGTSLVANLDLGAATLTSVTAFRFWDWVPNSDRDYIGLPITTVSANNSQQQQVSQEVRLASNGSHALDYVAGLFYFHQTVDVRGFQTQGSAASRFLLAPSNTNSLNPQVLNGLTQSVISHLDNTSAAAFGKLTWHVTDRFSIAPGIRINYDQKDATYDAVITTGQGAVLNCSTAAQAASSVTKDQCGVLAPQRYAPHLSKWNVSGDVTAALRVADDINAYATYARSYKSAGVNLSGLPLDANNDPILASATVQPEKVDHYELGLKTQLFDRRATVNLAAFWTNIFDYQATVNNSQYAVLRGYLANAGQVRARGLEFDAAVRATRRLNLYANGAYTDAKYIRFVDAPCPPELTGGTTAAAGQAASPAGTPGGISPASCNISGQILPGVSKWAFSYGAEYDLPAHLLGSDGQVYAGIDGSYRSSFSSNPSASAYTTVYGYALTNFRVGYRVRDRWNVFGWVRNAFDTRYFDLLAVQSGSTGLVVGQPGDPRTFGATVSRSF